jgi:hypothetical protein
MGRLMPTPERTLTWQVRLPTDTQAQKSSSGGSESRSQEENDAAWFMSQNGSTMKTIIGSRRWRHLAMIAMAQVILGVDDPGVPDL